MTSVTAVPRETGSGAKLGARLTLILVCLVWATHSSSLNTLMGSNATAQIVTHFRTTEIAWFSLAPTLINIFLAPLIYWAATIYGKRRVMLIVAVTALIGDVVAATATTYPIMVFGRTFSGLYASAAVITYAITRDIFPKKSVGQASGGLAGGVAVVGVAGPFLSAWVLDSHGFRGVLWAMTVITAITVVMLLFFIPESPVRAQRKPFDFIGGFLLGAGMTAAIYGLGQGSTWGWTDARTLVLIIGGLAAIVAFVFVEAKVPHPVFPVSLLRRRPVWSMIIATSVVLTAQSVGTIGYLLALLPRIPHVSAGLGFSATHYAVIGIPSSAVMLATAIFAGRLARTRDPRLLLATGSLLFAISMVLNVFYHYDTTQLMLLGPIGGVGMGLIIASAPILIISAVRPEEQVLGNGAQGLVVGLVGAVATQLAYVILAQHSVRLQGYQFYSDTSFKDGYWLFAGIGVLGFAACFLMPKMKRLDDVETGQALT